MITAAFDSGWEWIWEIPLILVIYGTGQPSGGLVLEAELAGVPRISVVLSRLIPTVSF